jgi:hypothetical protein
LRAGGKRFVEQPRRRLDVALVSVSFSHDEQRPANERIVGNGAR